MKRCPKCGEVKPLCEFHKDKYKKDGHKSRCADCCRKDRVEWRKKNLEKALQQERECYRRNKEKCLMRSKRWQEENMERVRQLDRERYERDREKRIRASCEWSKKNREYVNERVRQWYERTKPQRLAYFAEKRKDPKYRAVYNLRRRLNFVLKGERKAGRFFEILGCDADELRTHIESQFTEGMSWDNYGEWHIDHIKPCAMFDLTKPDQQKKCFHYANLQPLWATDNLKKGCKVSGY
jgi:hypothetical protein